MDLAAVTRETKHQSDQKMLQAGIGNNVSLQNLKQNRTLLEERSLYREHTMPSALHFENWLPFFSTMRTKVKGVCFLFGYKLSC
jgi:hypothetical protein